MQKIHFLFILTTAFFLTFCGNRQSNNRSNNAKAEKIDVPVFNADSAYSFVEKQVAFGPRVPETKAHKACLEYISDKLKSYGLDVAIQEGRDVLYNGQAISIKNIIATFNPSSDDRILLAAHWDSRPFADHDKDKSKHKTPILGANDGASGVGVIIEVVRNLSSLPQTIGVDVVFFDVEDYGVPYFYEGKPENDGWCIGSKYWSNNLHYSGNKPNFGILLDMVGSPSARFYQEQYSLRYAPQIVDLVWNRAIEAGFSGYFIPNRGGAIIDDHLAVNEIAKIKMIDIIHYEPNNENGFNHTWHTTSDNMNNIDKNTLYAVGQTLLNVIFNH